MAQQDIESNDVLTLKKQPFSWSMEPMNMLVFINDSCGMTAVSPYTATALRGNREISPERGLDNVALQANVIHVNLRKFVGKLGALLNKKKLHPDTTQQIAQVNELKKRYKKNVGQVVAIYDSLVDDPKDSASLEWINIEDLCNITENLLIYGTDEQKEQYDAAKALIAVDEEAMKKSLKDLDVQFKNEDAISINGHEEPLLCNDGKLLKFLYAAEESAKAFMDTTRIPIAFKDMLRDVLVKSGQQTFRTIYDFIKNEPALHIPPVYNLALETQTQICDGLKEVVQKPVACYRYDNGLEELAHVLTAHNEEHPKLMGSKCPFGHG